MCIRDSDICCAHTYKRHHFFCLALYNKKNTTAESYTCGGKISYTIHLFVPTRMQSLFNVNLALVLPSFVPDILPAFVPNKPTRYPFVGINVETGLGLGWNLLADDM